MEHSQALEIALRLVEAMRPGCTRIEIAGGVRRGKKDSHDIEIVGAPILKAPRPVFGQKVLYRTMLDPILCELQERHVLSLIKGGEKFKQYHVYPAYDGLNSITLDLFLVTPPAEFGVLYLIRTGPEDFSHWMVTKRSQGGALPSSCSVIDGAVWPIPRAVVKPEPGSLSPYPMPEERDFFAFCGLEYMEPDQRAPKWVRR